jgi:hypothetical protein
MKSSFKTSAKTSAKISAKIRAKLLIPASLIIALANSCATGTVINGDEIEAPLLAKSPDFKTCYLKVAPKEPSGFFRVHFVILPDGSVVSADIQENTLKSPPIEGCVVDTLKQIKFPKSAKNGRIEVIYPFKFHAHDSVEPEPDSSPSIQQLPGV